MNVCVNSPFPVTALGREDETHPQDAPQVVSRRRCLGADMCLTWALRGLDSVFAPFSTQYHDPARFLCKVSNRLPWPLRPLPSLPSGVTLFWGQGHVF